MQVALQLEAIKPETVTTYEIGEKSSFFDGRLLPEASLFNSDYRNEQVFVLVSLGPLSP